MRIIAGEFRGRQLLAPEGDATRPITDRVKQSLFDILAPRMADAAVLDIFAGTGSMGLESLSRAAGRAWFFEADRAALSRLRRNIDALRLPPDRAVVVAGDLFKWFASWETRPDEPPKVDIAFLDPPYRFLRQEPDRLRLLVAQLARRHLNPDAVVVFRHVTDVRTYGGMTLEFLHPGQQDPTPPGS
jgi:16S rRNA (guanine966-N2)-methyltransferase